MSSKFSMSAVLSLVDNMTNPYKKTTSKITALNRAVVKSFKTAATIGIGAFTAATVLATKEFIKLDSATTNAGAKFKDLDSGSKTFTKDLKALQTEAREVAKVTEFMATDTAGALDKMAMAGMTSVQAMELLQGTTNLATSAGTDLTTAVDIATDSLGAFDLEASKLNLDKVSDQMAKVTTTANTDLLSMFESVKTGAPAFTAAGQKISTFNSLVGKLANAGIKGGESGTSLRNMILRLSKPTGEASKVISDLGVNIQDSQGNFRDIIDIIGDFEKGLKGMGTAQKTAALTTVFGARSVTGFNILLNEGQTELRKYQKSIEDSSGASKKMADAIRNSIGNRIKVLKSGLSELGLQFIETFETQGRNGLDFLIDKVQNFDMKPVIKGIKEVGRFFKKTFDKLRPGIESLVNSFKPLLRFLVSLLLPAFQLISDVLLFILPVIDSVIDGFVRLGNSFKKSGDLKKTVDAFKKLGNMIMSLQPILNDMVNTFFKFIESSGLLSLIAPVFKVIASAVRIVFNVLKILWAFYKPVVLKFAELLRPVIDMYKKFAESVGVAVEAIANASRKAADWMGENGMLGAITVALDAAKGAFFTFADVILSTYGNIFKTIIKGASQVGKFLGMDTTGLDKVVTDISNAQAKIRGESFIGGRNNKPTLGINQQVPPEVLQAIQTEQIEKGQQQKANLTDIENEKRQRQQESTQRNDIYLHGSAGFGISDTPGGSPSTAVNIGKQ